MGDFRLRGIASFSTLDATTTEPRAILAAGVLDPSSVTLTALRAEVCAYAYHYIESTIDGSPQRIGDPRDAPVCSNLTHARIGATALLPENWVGIHPQAGAVAEINSSASTVEHRNDSILAPKGAETAQSKGSDGAIYPYYFQEVKGDHLLDKSDGSLDYLNAGRLKLSGFELSVSSDTGVFTVETRSDDPGGLAPHQTVLRWAVVTFDGAAVHVESPALQVATTAMGLSWDGKARFTPESGTLTSGSVTRTPDQSGEAVWVDGQFSGALGFKDDAEALQFQGAMRASSLRLPTSDDTPASAGGSFNLLAAIAVGTVVVGGAGAVGAWALRKRHEPRPRDLAEHYHDIAGYCRDAGDERGALVWTEKARAQAPRTANLAAGEAEAFARLGNVPFALKAYADAHDLADHGQYALAAALLLRQYGHGLDVVMERLGAALLKSPKLLVEIEQDFPEVVFLPAWKHIARTALLERE